MKKVKLFFERLRNTLIVFWSDLIISDSDYSYEYSNSFFRNAKEFVEDKELVPYGGHLVAMREVLPVVQSQYAKQLIAKRAIIDNVNKGNQLIIFIFRQIEWYKFCKNGYLPNHLLLPRIL